VAGGKSGRNRTRGARVDARVKARPPARRGGFWRFVRRLLVFVLLVALIAPPASVLVYRFVPPPITMLMVIRLVQGHGMDYRWRALDHISPALRQAVVASEDQRFCEHHGFDFSAMEKAMQANERRPDKLRGGSTISQQTAKNVFLWPGRSYLGQAANHGGLSERRGIRTRNLWRAGRQPTLLP
jgi:membrane peptidoglycan carboxypeptidase